MRSLSNSRIHGAGFLSTCALCLLSIALLKCDKAGPFAASLFNNTLPGVPTIGGIGTGGATGDIAVYEFLDQIPQNLRTFRHGVANSSPFPVRNRALFVVTAGEGGFVREEDAILDYLSAGYRDLIPPGSPVGATIRIGCVPLQLTRGTRLLGMTSGDFLGQEFFTPANMTGDPNMFAGPGIDVRNDNRDPNIPLPELIVFTTDNPEFNCRNPLQACTQEAFQFFDLPMTQQVGNAVIGSRIQGTVCNLGIGQSPEVRLDRSNDGAISPFQFAPGSTVVWRVLDRQFDATTDTRNQVVWTVVDVDGNVLHTEEP